MTDKQKSILSKNLPLIIVIAVSALVRAALLAEHYGHPLFTFMIVDENEYHAWAQMAATLGGLFPDTVANHGPGYPWALAMVYEIFGEGTLAPKIMQMLFGLASAALVYLIGEEMFGRREAFISGLLFGLYWPLMLFEQRLLAVSLFTLLCLASLYVMIKAEKNNSFRLYALAGLLAGLSMITRSTSMFFLAAVLLWLLARAIRGRDVSPVLYSLALLTGACLVLIPIASGSRQATGRWSLAQDEGGLNLFIGNNPESDGTPYARPGGVYDRLQAMPMIEAKIFDPASQDKFYTSKVAEFVKNDPAGFIRLAARKAALLFNRREVRATFNPEFQRGLFFATSLPLPGFGLILTLALPGLLALRKKERSHWPLLLFLAGSGAAIVATVVSSRYRLPFTSALTILSGAGAIMLYESALKIKSHIKGSQKSAALKIAAPFILFIAGAGISAIPLGLNYTEAEDLAYLASAYADQGDFEKAEQNARRSLEIEPNYAGAFNALSSIAGKSGDIKAARAWLEKSLAADPGSGSAHFRMGTILWETGEKEKAIFEMSRAIELKPQWLPGISELALREWELGMKDRALQHLRYALAMYPDYLELRGLIGRLEREAADER